MDRQTLISMSQDEYRSLDIAQFILDNVGRYASSVISALKASFGAVDHDEVCNSIFVASYERLKSVHAKNLDAKGLDRAKLLFTPLKMIATRDVPRKFKQMFALGVEERVTDVAYKARYHQDAELPGEWYEKNSEWDCFMLAAATSDVEDPVEVDPWSSSTTKAQERKRSLLVESLRHKLPRVEYQILRCLVCDELSHAQIGPKLSITANNVSVVRHHLRKRLASFQPSTKSEQEAINAA